MKHPLCLVAAICIVVAFCATAAPPRPLAASSCGDPASNAVQFLTDPTLRLRMLMVDSTSGGNATLYKVDAGGHATQPLCLPGFHPTAVVDTLHHRIDAIVMIPHGQTVIQGVSVVDERKWRLLPTFAPLPGTNAVSDMAIDESNGTVGVSLSSGVFSDTLYLFDGRRVTWHNAMYLTSGSLIQSLNSQLDLHVDGASSYLTVDTTGTTASQNGAYVLKHAAFGADGTAVGQIGLSQTNQTTSLFAVYHSGRPLRQLLAPNGVEAAGVLPNRVIFFSDPTIYTNAPSVNGSIIVTNLSGRVLQRATLTPHDIMLSDEIVSDPVHGRFVAAWEHDVDKAVGEYAPSSRSAAYVTIFSGHGKPHIRVFPGTHPILLADSSGRIYIAVTVLDSQGNETWQIHTM